MHHKSLDQ